MVCRFFAWRSHRASPHSDSSPLLAPRMPLSGLSLFEEFGDAFRFVGNARMLLNLESAVCPRCCSPRGFVHSHGDASPLLPFRQPLHLFYAFFENAGIARAYWERYTSETCSEFSSCQLFRGPHKFTRTATRHRQPTTRSPPKGSQTKRILNDGPRPRPHRDHDHGHDHDDDDDHDLDHDHDHDPDGGRDHDHGQDRDHDHTTTSTATTTTPRPRPRPRQRRSPHL